MRGCGGNWRGVAEAHFFAPVRKKNLTDETVKLITAFDVVRMDAATAIGSLRARISRIRARTLSRCTFGP